MIKPKTKSPRKPRLKITNVSYVILIPISICCARRSYPLISIQV